MNIVVGKYINKGLFIYLFLLIKNNYTRKNIYEKFLI